MDYDYEVGGKILIVKDGIIRKAESPKQKRTMDHHTSSHKWNNQGYAWNQIGEIKYPESRTNL